MEKYTVKSPSGAQELTFTAADGKVCYQVLREGKCVVDPSPLGLVLPELDLSEGLVFTGAEETSADESYTIPAFKKSVCRNCYKGIILHFEKEGCTLLVEGRVFDDGAAVRLGIPGEGEVLIDHETTGFMLPDTVSEVTAMKWLCSYEDHYHPVPAEELFQNLYAFPVLYRSGKNNWTLIAEAAVFGDYGGSVLGADREEPDLLKVKKAVDKLDCIRAALPVYTPWRAVLNGTLDEIVNGNLLENLCPESVVSDPSFIEPGMAAWSWSAEHSSPRDSKRMHQYVDFAAAMGWPYSIVDGGWPGVIDIPELVEYAAAKKVKIWIWSHSRPLRDPEVVDREFALWKSWGVAGVKIDFFESDKQERAAQYAMLAELAAKHRLMLNFHGCMKPSGTIRCWPHVLSYEGVQGGEYLANFSTFTPMGPDAAHNCTLPFTRNVMGPMDYTPVCYATYITGTTDAHQTALPVVFLSYITHCAERKETVETNVCREFLSGLPTAWDESRLLEGTPANFVTMARRKGAAWYIGGICARRPRNAEIVLDFVEQEEYSAEIWQDDLSDLRPSDAAVGALGEMTPEIVASLEEMFQRPCQHQHDIHKTLHRNFTVKKGETLVIPESVNGGFALKLRPKRA